ncbi:MAG: UDP-N-acetylmuramoyl-L-alanyl-D-glutamate--2,6-diaminopimelate ligase [Acidimicrobiia bacterium]|nr:UDP-N-acetylmuramoyl-L-alanyl-D-glutamate--2,6-diaminopimelate ligase [Acidimicrobiia bacterium]
MFAEPVTLARLAEVESGEILGDPATVISDVTHDSRVAGPGDLFVAIRGAFRDGHEYVAASRAAAACVEEASSASIPLLVVADTRAALGGLAAEVHGHPSRDLQVVGITGTNGKTTVAHMLAAIVDAAGGVPGVVGTVGARIGDEHLDLERTSPEASDLQRLLRKMVDAGVGVAAVEVSSHAQVLGRTAATDFAVVAFTNLSQDHLDMHGDMESYFQAKASLFYESGAFPIINTDDPWGRRLAAMLDRPVTTVGMDGEFSAQRAVPGLASSSFQLVTPAGTTGVVLPLGGTFNIDNALLAAACARRLGYDLGAIGAGLGSVEPIPGRMEPVDAGQEPAIIVDYAHTPEGIEQVLASVRPLVAGKVIVVVGAGGDRDAAKRPDMGRAAAQADVLFVTSDNPRSEDPGAIIGAVSAGADGPATIAIEPDRRTAIEKAIAAAHADDVVLVLGKGHETGQEIAGQVLPFDDREVAREAVRGQ